MKKKKPKNTISIFKILYYKPVSVIYRKKYCKSTQISKYFKYKRSEIRVVP